MPGAISIKYATYTGYKIAGVYGAIVANLGNLFAPILIIIFSSIFYFKYKDLPYIKAAFRTIQLAAFAMILAVAFKLIDINLLFQFKSIIIVIISFSLFMYTRIHPALIILVAGVLGAVSTFIRH